MFVITQASEDEWRTGFWRQLAPHLNRTWANQPANTPAYRQHRDIQSLQTQQYRYEQNHCGPASQFKDPGSRDSLYRGQPSGRESPKGPPSSGFSENPPDNGYPKRDPLRGLPGGWYPGGPPGGEPPGREDSFWKLYNYLDEQRNCILEEQVQNPTAKVYMKLGWDDILQWNRNSSMIKFLLQADKLACTDLSICRDLAKVIPPHFKGEAKDWWMLVDKDFKHLYMLTWCALREGICFYFFMMRFINQLNNEFCLQGFQQPGHCNEMSLQFIHCQLKSVCD